MRVIDGRYGEGGGQILRTVVAAAALTGSPVRLEHIRAGRPHPGLGAQHLTAARAAAAVCGARLKGDSLGSTELTFEPGHPPRAGDYAFDVAAARPGGSAGAVGPILQTVIPLLLRAGGVSSVALEGGTHIQQSPTFDYLAQVWLPALAGMGAEVSLTLECTGWYPVGRGRVEVRIDGQWQSLTPFALRERGTLDAISGTARAANLPEHIPLRMVARARELLAARGLDASLEAHTEAAACPGAGLFLAARHRHCRAGFTALGRRGLPAEVVAEMAVADLLDWLDGPDGLEPHLADQLILPAALAGGVSRYTVQRVTRHLLTVAWVVSRMGLADVVIDPQQEGAPGEVRATPRHD